MIKVLKDKLYTRAGIKSQRTKNITKHVVLSFVYKGGSIIANFLLVPLTINYLDTENYGVWLTLSSFIAWFTFFDIGLGNGLRNKFAEAKAKGDLLLARAYVSSAYYTIGTVCLILIALFFLINFFVDWTKVFNTSTELHDDLKLLMPFAFGFFCLQLVTKLITTIYTADQHHSMQGKVNFLTQVGSLLVIWLITYAEKSSLLLFGISFSVFPVMILIVINLLAFNGQYRQFKPVFSLWKMSYLRGIFGLGFKFLIIQATGIVLFATDNFIISHMFTPAEVVPYNVAYKYFGIISMVYNIIATPYWSSITEAYQNKEIGWIKVSINNLIVISIIFTIASIVMLLFSNIIYSSWIGESIKIPLKLSILMCLFNILTIFLQPFIFFINGVGKIKIQLLISVFTAIINIPLAIFLIKHFNSDISSVILATIICFIPGLILAPIQYNKIINGKERGIWSE